jgi:hypothetical protein
MDGFFLTADLLGFSNIVRNSDDEQLSSRIGDWIKLVDEAKAVSKLFNRTQLISDTVFVGAESTHEGLRAIISFAQTLLNVGSRSSLPVRGAISHGQFEWGSLTYGRAVIRSHQLESQQNWLGITCDNELPHVDSMWGFDGLVCYPPPMKDGPVLLMPVVSWDVPTFTELRQSLLSKGLVRAGEYMAWPWAQKVSNTIEFGSYLMILKKAGGDIAKFHGTLPSETIEVNLSQFLLKAQPPDLSAAKK